jgi:hypothetical protein
LGIAREGYTAFANTAIDLKRNRMRNIVEAHKILHIRFDDGESFDVEIKPFIKSGVSNSLNERIFQLSKS